MRRVAHCGDRHAGGLRFVDRNLHGEMRRHMTQSAAAIHQRRNRRLLYDRRPHIHLRAPIAAHPVIARQHRHAMTVHAMQIGPGKDVRCRLGVLLRHAPGDQNRFDLRAMRCVRCRHDSLLEGLRSALRGRHIPASVPRGDQRCAMADSAELLRARFGIDLPGVEVPPEVAPLLDRRVTRRYTEQSVPDSLLDALLAAAQSAPTKSDLQQYSVVVMRDRARIKQIADWIATMDWIALAPVFLVWCGDMRRGQRLCALHNKPTPTTTSTPSSTPRSTAPWRWASSSPPPMPPASALARSATCAATSSAS